MSENETTSTDVPQLDEESTSRRHLLGKGAIAAAAATVAGIAMSKSAEAVDGEDIRIGLSRTAQSSTSLPATVAIPGQVLLIDDQSGFVATDSANPGALAGWSGTRVGVYGFSGSAQGVVGRAGAGGVGVEGQGNPSGGGVDFMASRSGIVFIQAAGVATTPVGGLAGMLARDSTGSLWYCFAAGLWRRIAGATTGGAFHPITPVRVYDSRAATPTPGVLAPNTSRVVSVKDGRDSGGVVTAANVVPAGATAVSFNLTATATTDSNFLSVVPGDAIGFTTSNINWTGAGVNIANGGIVKLDATRQIKVFCGDQPGSTHFIVDVSGYYL